MKYVVFTRHFINCWELNEDITVKFLLVNHDEKGSWGLVMQTNAKMCKALGIEKHEWYTYHKCQTDKVMAISCTGYAFVCSIPDGGEAIKLGLFWCQAARIAKKITEKK